jgi:tricorn protease
MLPYNVSRHPDNEGRPRWSPDGKILAFTGRRHGEEYDIFYVWLQKQDDETSRRERSEEEALEAMKKGRKADPVKNKKKLSPAAAMRDPLKGIVQGLERLGERSKKLKEKAGEAAKEAKQQEAVDFEGLASRVRRISIPDTGERGLFWSPDSKKFAFSAEVNGVEGVYTVEFPDKLSPSLLVAKPVSHARWLEKDERIVWLERGVPGSFSKGKQSSYQFSAAQSFDQAVKFRIAFLQIWRAMRDHYYDGAHNGHDWDEIRKKYEAAAAGAVDLVAFETVVAMVLGELNGSHLGFRPNSKLRPQIEAGEWKRETAHLGVSFVETDGRLVVDSVIPRGPADREASRLEPGDVIISLGGVEAKTHGELLAPLNGLPGQLIDIVVERSGKVLEPQRVPTVGYARARSLRQQAWVDTNRREVERRSRGRFGYLYVERMMWDEFENFEREIYAVGAGKDGIVIDVRDNGGGFTADHLLTVLTPPEHAVTVPRGGGMGYPGDRRVYGTWSKPIVVLCNQNSFSNAEIFAHAVKVLGRGKLVGVPTAGGVISTGAASIMDIGTLRMPFRGWFKSDDGEDMELNGAQPDIVIWPRPGELPAGVDRQLRKAISVLEEEVEAYSAEPRPTLRRASERR